MLAKLLGTWFLLFAAASSATTLFAHTRKQTRLRGFGLIALGVNALIFAALAVNDLAMQKLISYLAMPVALLWTALGALAVYLFAKEQRASAAFAGVLFLIYGVLGNPMFSASLARNFEEDIPEYSLASGESFDAVLVLGGGIGFRASGDVQLSDQGDRTILGARLWYAKKTPILIASGSTIPGFDEVQDLSLAAKSLWVELGIPPEAIVQSSEPKNTSQELIAFQRLAEERGWKKLGVISSRWHLPRIMRGARAIGLEVTPVPADHRGAKAIYHPTLLIPQAGPWKVTQLICWETLGMLAGR